MPATAYIAEPLLLNCRLPTPPSPPPRPRRYSILKQRLARRLKHEGADASKLDLVAVTKAAERTITSDLEYLISKAVDPAKADYAVFTGVQVGAGCWAASRKRVAGRESLRCPLAPREQPGRRLGAPAGREMPAAVGSCPISLIPAAAVEPPSSPQIHNWAADLEDPSIPSLEFVGVGKSYVVVNGEKTFLDVHQVGAGCWVKHVSSQNG